MHQQLPPLVAPGTPSHWYQEAIIYELHVRAFYDSDGDGIGDFCGLTEKLDYLQELGVTALWLLPFFPSPLKDDGYDIADYTNVHPSYGTLDDFRTLLEAAHQRDMRVIIELVLNHTSDQHPWFQRARRAPKGSVERDFYVWSDTAERYEAARIIFQDYEASNWAWDPLAEAYYWHRFYSHQPDLNYDNPAVRAAIFEVVDFWLALGVDGLRLDAVPYLYERDGTAGENLQPTHALLKQLRAHIDARFDERMLLAEANQWPEDAAAYFGAGDECQMNFHFPLMPRLFMALRNEDRFPIEDILAQTPPIPANCQWALFLRNHDELTLEMVTDEERVSMYRAYAPLQEARINLGIRRRLAPLLNNNRRQIELLHGLLCALPGTPVIYYGDEIGMGDNVYLGDRDGVRTPMQWSADRNAGFSQAHPQQLYLPLITDFEYHHTAVHVEAQEQNPHSLLHWMRRLLALRQRYTVFGTGSMRFLTPSNSKVLAFVRQRDDQTVLVVANLSRCFQHVELDLSAFQGHALVELMGQTRLPTIGDLPYTLTLSGHAFHWFLLEHDITMAQDPTATILRSIPTLDVVAPWHDALRGPGRRALAALLPAYLRQQPWFLHKEQPIAAVSIEDVVLLGEGSDLVALVLVGIDYTFGDSERYQLALAYAEGAAATHIEQQHTSAVVARLASSRTNHGAAGLLYDAAMAATHGEALLAAISSQQHQAGTRGSVVATLNAPFEPTRMHDTLVPTPIADEQSNTSLRFGDALVLKLFRHLDAGINPEMELGMFLAQQHFPHTAPLVGALTYQHGRQAPTTLAVLHRAVVGEQGTVWQHTLAQLDQALAHSVPSMPLAQSQLHAAALLATARELPAASVEALGSYQRSVQLLGQRTAELHLALAATDVAAFAPEAFNPLYQRSLYQAMRGLTGQTLRALRASTPGLDGPTQQLAHQVLDHEQAMLAQFGALMTRPISAMRIRCHGDYHLGQVLHTGEDVVIIDFEGEPGRPLLERQIKHSPLVDLAGMIQSWAYAAQHYVFDSQVAGRALDEHSVCWLRAWQHAAGATFVQAYLNNLGEHALLPKDDAQLGLLLDAYLLQKAIYTVNYELNHRPQWLPIALRCLLDLVATTPQRAPC
jgi:maltose alpha-D-glucosyltransferase / alpha-amylase